MGCGPPLQCQKEKKSEGLSRWHRSRHRAEAGGGRSPSSASQPPGIRPIGGEEPKGGGWVSSPWLSIEKGERSQVPLPAGTTCSLRSDGDANKGGGKREGGCRSSLFPTNAPARHHRERNRDSNRWDRNGGSHRHYPRQHPYMQNKKGGRGKGGHFVSRRPCGQKEIDESEAAGSPSLARRSGPVG